MVPLADFATGKAMVARKYEGQPLPRDHWGPRACSCRISTFFGRRIDARMVADVAARLPVSPGCAFVCGSNAFVDIAADAALALGLEARAIKTERYGV